MKKYVHFLLFCMCFWGCLESNALEREDPVPLTDEEISVTAETEQKSYQLGEPVWLCVTVTNISNHNIEFCIGNAFWYLNFSQITIIPPKGKEKKLEVSVDEQGNLQKREVVVKDLQQPLEPSLKAYDIVKTSSSFYKPHILIPQSSYTFGIPLGLIYDFSYPYGIYTVKIGWFLTHQMKTIYRKELSTEFEIKGNSNYVSMQSMTQESIIRLFGRKRAHELLCDEAENILAEFKKQPGAKWKNSPDHSRFKDILRMLKYQFPRCDLASELNKYNGTNLSDYEHILAIHREVGTF